MEGAVLIAAVAILACVVISNFSSKAGLPTLFIFMLMGLLAGNIGVIPDQSEYMHALAEFSEVNLAFIMFYGGFITRWSSVKKMALPGITLASVGVILMVLVAGLFTHLLLGLGWMESLLIAAIIGSTDSASVFAALRSKRMGLKHNTAALIEMESATNDPFAIIATGFVLLVMMEKHGMGAILGLTALQLVLGIVCGLAIATLSLLFIRKVPIFGTGQGPLLLIAIALLSWSVPSAIGGSGFISVYLVGLVLGNSDIANKRQQVHFFEGLTSLMQLVIFFMLGLCARFGSLWGNLGIAVVIFLILTFISRPLVTFLVLRAFKKFPPKQILLVAFSGLRGAPAVVLSIFAATSGIDFQTDLFSIVFVVVLLSTSINGYLLPHLASWLGMQDDSIDALETFNDFADETDRQFCEILITESSPWAGKSIMDIGFPKNTLVVLVVHPDGSSEVPNGHTVLLPGHRIVLCAKSFNDNNLLKINKYRLFKGDKAIGRTIRESSFGKNRVMLVVREDGETLTAHSSTLLQEGDLLYINQK